MQQDRAAPAARSASRGSGRGLAAFHALRSHRPEPRQRRDHRLESPACLRSRLRTSYPSKPGIPISSSTKSGLNAEPEAKRRLAVVAELAHLVAIVTAGWPPGSPSAASTLSSTTRMRALARWLPLQPPPLHEGCRARGCDGAAGRRTRCPCPALAVRRDAAAVQLDQAS